VPVSAINGPLHTVDLNAGLQPLQRQPPVLLDPPAFCSLPHVLDLESSINESTHQPIPRKDPHRYYDHQHLRLLASSCVCSGAA